MITRKNATLLLSVVGIGISSYLAYAKLTSNELICGSSSGCGIVQNSKYSEFLGIPIGVWGMGYYFFLYTLMYAKEGKMINKFRKMSVILGILFSSYLTYLEAFVIHAYCLWCVASFINIIIIGVLYFSGTHKKIENENNNLL